MRNNGWFFERMLWLYKTAQCVYPWRGWLLQSEAILIFSKGKPSWVDKKPYAHDCYQLRQVANNLPEDCGWHGSVKPMTVVQDILARIGGLCFDPFLGSGSTLIACERLGRVCYGMEIVPHYCDVIVKRWEDYTGQKAARNP